MVKSDFPGQGGDGGPDYRVTVEFLPAGAAARTQASRQASLEQTQEYRSAQCISPSIFSVSKLV